MSKLITGQAEYIFLVERYQVNYDSQSREHFAFKKLIDAQEKFKALVNIEKADVAEANIYGNGTFIYLEDENEIEYMSWKEGYFNNDYISVSLIQLEVR